MSAKTNLDRLVTRLLNSDDPDAVAIGGRLDDALNTYRNGDAGARARARLDIDAITRIARNYR